MPPFGTAENPAAARRCGKPRATGAASLPTLLRSCLRLCRGVVQTVPLCVLFRRCVVCRCLWRPASFTENSLNMAPFGSPSVPAGSSGPHSANPAAGRRLSSAEPLRVSGCSLVSDGEGPGRACCVRRTRRSHRPAHGAAKPPRRSDVSGVCILSVRR